MSQLCQGLNWGCVCAGEGGGYSVKFKSTISYEYSILGDGCMECFEDCLIDKFFF